MKKTIWIILEYLTIFAIVAAIGLGVFYPIHLIKVSAAREEAWAEGYRAGALGEKKLVIDEIRYHFEAKSDTTKSGLIAIPK